VLQARLDEAEETCQQALETDSEHRVRRVAAKSILYIPLSTVMCERNDLDAAEKCILQGIGLGEPGGYYRIVTYGYLNLALVKYTKRDLQGAVAALKTAYQAAKRMGMHGLIDQIASHQARLSVAEGDLTAANRWAREHEPFINRKSGYTRELEYLTLARVHLTQSNPKEALQLLTEAGQAAEGAGRTGSLIEILVLQAIALQMQGNVDQALIPLERALALGEPNGYVQTFISEGKPMEELLRQAVSRGISPDYATTLLAAFGKSSGKLGGAIILGNVDQSVIESLTERELQVLRLICTGMSNQQIAQQLMVVEGTVKTHISNIFGKLDVHNRTHAIARAKELGILK
jgi:LuxR family maltose regulon positive regulatory protein